MILFPTLFSFCRFFLCHHIPTTSAILSEWFWSPYFNLKLQLVFLIASWAPLPEFPAVICYSCPNNTYLLSQASSPSCIPFSYCTTTFSAKKNPSHPWIVSLLHASYLVPRSYWFYPSKVSSPPRNYNNLFIHFITVTTTHFFNKHILSQLQGAGHWVYHCVSDLKEHAVL